jgi:hypothetical protein
MSDACVWLLVLTPRTDRTLRFLDTPLMVEIGYSCVHCFASAKYIWCLPIELSAGAGEPHKNGTERRDFLTHIYM